MIKLNTPFTCKNCGEKNPPHKDSCRNHCRKCLYSQHVDESTPGDRKSPCKHLMPPVSATQNGKKGWIITHKCEKCGKLMPNKSAEDDNFEEIISLTHQKQHEPARNHKTRK
ncbi:MAG: RNHCP domain-containing protein [Candidatus Peregrinibacteria bacterium]